MVGGVKVFAEGVNATFPIHDPSRIVRFGDRYWIFFTGHGCLSAWSTDRTNWFQGPAIFPSGLPTWAATAAPGNNGDVWAPDILFLNGEYHLYYCISVFGKNTSGIGVATNPTLDPASSNYKWTDQGIVIQTVASDNFNALDPCPVFDAAGNPWLAFGSYWSGIKLIQLNPLTGKRITPTSNIYSLAYNGSIEASYIQYHNGWYYLFVNWDSCCQGVNSTYNVRVGRSRTITGPYLDRDGVAMINNGGSIFRATTGRYVGPGHVGIFSEGTNDWVGMHFYDANKGGTPSLDLRALNWSADGWPQVDDDWEAFYSFRTDFRDETDVYEGRGNGGASVQIDAERGHVLDLSGTNQFLTLPGGVANAHTFAAWVKWSGGDAWQRVFDFGVDQTRYCYLSPMSGVSQKLRFAITASGSGAEQVIDWTQALPVNIWTHVAVTLDGQRGILYVNGAPAATNATMNLIPANVFATHNYLGKSQWPDPYFKGRIDSLRVLSHVATPSEIRAMTNAAPPEIKINYDRDAGASVLKWPAVTTDFSLEQAFELVSSLSWSPLRTRPAIVNGWNQLTNFFSASPRYFRFSR
jgi:hypothetical protein